MKQWKKLLAAVLAVQTSCEVNGGVIGYLIDSFGGSEEEIAEEEIAEEELYIPKVSDETKLVPVYQVADWWDSMSGGPDFRVSNAQELINAAYYVNHVFQSGTTLRVTITLTKDIDLSGYLWEPIGSIYHQFYGEINGQGHTIKNMTIRDAGDCAGFIGEPSLGYSDNELVVRNITFTNASITGGKKAGIVCGCCKLPGTWKKVKAYGEITADAGAVVGVIGGDITKATMEKCSGKVILNGEEFSGLSNCDVLENPHEKDFNIEMTNDGRIYRTGNYTSAVRLRWVVLLNGEKVFEQECGDGLSLSTDSYETEESSGAYEVFLEASFDGGKAVRCSNILEYSKAVNGEPAA